MSELSKTLKEAKEYNVEVGKLTTSKSRGEYILYEDGRIVAEGYYDTAAEIKIDYINEQMYKNAKWDE